MPPILTYSFFPGLVGSSASLNSSACHYLLYLVAGWLTYVVGPFKFHRHVRIAVVVGFYSFYDGEGGKILHEYNGGSVGECKGVVEAC